MPKPMFTPRERWIGLLLVLLTVGVFFPVSQHEFVNYDDPVYVTANPHVQAGLTQESFIWAFGQLHGDQTYWHPLTWLSHMLDCQLFGVNAGAHHLVNLLFHTVNVLLLYVLMKRMTGAVWPSAMVAMLFAAHPLQVDAVAWVAERKTLLATFFWLLATLAYVNYAEKPAAGRYLLVLLWFALGLLSKPVLVTLPCALVLLDFWPLRRFPLARTAKPQTKNPLWFDPPHCPMMSVRRIVLEKLPMLALSAGSSLITVLGHRGLGITHEALGLTFKARFDNAVVSFARYLGKVFWPVDLAVLYPHPAVWPSEVVAICGMLLLGISVFAISLWRRAPYLLVGWLWFLGVLVPTIGLVQAGLQAMADRFLYIPIIGLFIAIIFGLADFSARWRHRETMLPVFAGATVALCLICTSLQLGWWRNTVSLFEHAIRVTSDNFVMHYDLGLTLQSQGKTDEAIAHLQEAQRINPGFAEVRQALGLISEHQQRLDEAVQYYRDAVRLKPEWIAPRKAIANILVHTGRIGDAIVEYSVVVQANPDDANAVAELGALLAHQQRTAEALKQWRAALQLKPDWPELLNNLAWLEATCPAAEFRNGSEAVQLAERACEITQYKRAVFIGTLAAAYAEAGRFSEAVSIAQKAHDLAVATGESECAAINLKLMEVYRANKAWRDEPGKPSSHE